MAFIDDSLQYGNVLLHCEQGQFRSPTLLVAWLVSRGFTVDKAIQTINTEYAGGPEWADIYKKNRAKWVKKLRRFQSKHEQISKYWRKTNRPLANKWKELRKSQGISTDSKTLTTPAKLASSGSNSQVCKSLNSLGSGLCVIEF